MADVEQSDDVDPDEVEDLDEVPGELDDDLGSTDDPVLEEEDFGEDEAEEVPVEVEVEEAVPTPSATKTKSAPRKSRSGDDDDDDEDDDEDDDDVEADLDTILKDRIAAAPDDEEDEDEVAAPETDERGDGTGKIQPRKPEEFVCQSCFLVKHPSQLADEDNMLCADCV